MGRFEPTDDATVFGHLLGSTTAEVVGRFEKILLAYSDALSHNLKTLLIRTCRRLRAEQMVYLMSYTNESAPALVGRFQGVLEALAIVDKTVTELGTASPAVYYRE